MSTQCPFCGADARGGHSNWFSCGTISRKNNVRIDQTRSCKDSERERLTKERNEAIRELATLRRRVEQAQDVIESTDSAMLSLIDTNGRITAERDDALARAKRLEEAGDPMAIELLSINSELSEDWTKAKEAK